MVMSVRIMLMMMMVMLVKLVMIMVFAKGMFFHLVQSGRIQNYNPRSIVVTSLQPHFLIASRSLL